MRLILLLMPAIETTATGFGDELRKLRRARLMSQEALAHSAGVSVRTIRNFERGAIRSPRASTLAVLTASLQLAAAEAEMLRRLAEPENDPQSTSDATISVVPAQLPLSPHFLLSRAPLSRRLDRILAPGTDPVPCVLTGPAGAGKTALAVLWGHQHRSEFVDGQLFVDLHGHDPDWPPVTADAALSQILRSLGVDQAGGILDLEARTSLFRSVVADRRLLLVIDDASSADQVRPLLPNGAACRVIVTSRSTLSGLSARDGAERVDVGLMSEHEAISVLHAGNDPSRGTPDQWRRLADLCANLPLALRVTAVQLAKHPRRPVDDYVSDLADDEQRWKSLDLRDAQSSVYLCLARSISRLRPDVRKLFLRLASGPAMVLGVEAIAAMSGYARDVTESGLEELADVHLVVSHADRRWSVHDLLRAVARHMVSDRSEVDQAHDRLLRFYADASIAHAIELFPDLGLGTPGEADERPPGTAEAWFTEEQDASVSLLTSMGTTRPETALRLALAWCARFHAVGNLADLRVAAEALSETAAAVGDRGALARAHGCHGVIFWRSGDVESARDEVQLALELYRGEHDDNGTANALNNLAVMTSWLGRLDEARQLHEQSLTLTRAADSGSRRIASLSNLGILSWRCGRYDEALAQHEEARHLSQHTGQDWRLTAALNNLGITYRRMGRGEEALDCHRQALRLARASGAQADQVESLGDLGLALQDLRREAEAEPLFVEALELATQIGETRAQAEAHHNLGVIQLIGGRTHAALANQNRALALAQQTRSTVDQLAAWNGVGEVLADQGQPLGAIAAHRHALSILDFMPDPWEQARAEAGIAWALRRLMRNDEAEPHQTRAHEILDRMSATTDVYWMKRNF